MKYHYCLIINSGKETKTKYKYSYGKTKNIELSLQSNSAFISFTQGVFHDPASVRRSDNAICTDAIKKAMLVHLILYGKPLSIHSLHLSINGSVTEVYHDLKNAPLVYSMINRKLDHNLPSEWKKESLITTILNSPKSSYDGRHNALLSLLIAKSKEYRSEKAMYLWMAMNGFYNYLSEQCKKLPECKLQFRREFKQHELLCAVLGEKYSVGNIDERLETLLFREGISRLRNCKSSIAEMDVVLENLFSNIPLEGKTDDGKQYSISQKAFVTVWIPYQIRCRYVHANDALPLFSYSDELLLKVLEITNHYVAKMLEQNLPFWLETKTVTEQQKVILAKALNIIK